MLAFSNDHYGLDFGATQAVELFCAYDISTGKIDWNEDGKMLVFELSDDKFIFNLCNFDKFPEFEMNNIFDVMNKNYSLVMGIHGNRGSFHENIVMTRMFKEMFSEE